VAFRDDDRRVVQGDGTGITFQQPDHEDTRRLAAQIPLPRVARRQVRGVGAAHVRSVPRRINGYTEHFVQSATTEIGQVTQGPAICRDRCGQPVRFLQRPATERRLMGAHRRQIW